MFVVGIQGRFLVIGGEDPSRREFDGSGVAEIVIRGVVPEGDFGGVIPGDAIGADHGPLTIRFSAPTVGAKESSVGKGEEVRREAEHGSREWVGPSLTIVVGVGRPHVEVGALVVVGASGRANHDHDATGGQLGDVGFTEPELRSRARHAVDVFPFTARISGLVDPDSLSRFAVAGDEEGAIVKGNTTVGGVGAAHGFLPRGAVVFGTVDKCSRDLGGVDVFGSGDVFDPTLDPGFGVGVGRQCFIAGRFPVGGKNVHQDLAVRGDGESAFAVVEDGVDGDERFGPSLTIVRGTHDRNGGVRSQVLFGGDDRDQDIAVGRSHHRRPRRVDLMIVVDRAMGHRGVACDGNGCGQKEGDEEETERHVVGASQGIKKRDRNVSVLVRRVKGRVIS